MCGSENSQCRLGVYDSVLLLKQAEYTVRNVKTIPLRSDLDMAVLATLVATVTSYLRAPSHCLERGESTITETKDSACL